jgi:hypothetical protein
VEGAALTARATAQPRAAAGGRELLADADG